MEWVETDTTTTPTGSALTPSLTPDLLTRGPPAAGAPRSARHVAAPLGPDGRWEAAGRGGGAAAAGEGAEVSRGAGRGVGALHAVPKAVATRVSAICDGPGAPGHCSSVWHPAAAAGSTRVKEGMPHFEGAAVWRSGVVVRVVAGVCGYGLTRGDRRRVCRTPPIMTAISALCCSSIAIIDRGLLQRAKVLTCTHLTWCHPNPICSCVLRGQSQHFRPSAGSLRGLRSRRADRRRVVGSPLLFQGCAWARTLCCVLALHAFHPPNCNQLPTLPLQVGP